MKRIQLITADHKHVAYVEIAPFPQGQEPGAVVWGSRFFVFFHSDKYREVFTVVSLTPSPGLGAVAENTPLPYITPVDRTAVESTDGTDVHIVRQQQSLQLTGQHSAYLVLSDKERAKGFVRPVRYTYEHLRCGWITSMGTKLAETYARDPEFYGSTMCVNCNEHFPVGIDGEFVWEGSTEKVGT